MAEGEQRISSSSDSEGGGQSLASDDLEAAKALAKFGIDALRLSKSGLTQEDKDSQVKRDLFDISHDPWKLKKIE